MLEMEGMAAMLMSGYGCSCSEVGLMASVCLMVLVSYGCIDDGRGLEMLDELVILISDLLVRVFLWNVLLGDGERV